MSKDTQAAKGDHEMAKDIKAPREPKKTSRETSKSYRISDWASI